MDVGRLCAGLDAGSNHSTGDPTENPPNPNTCVYYGYDESLRSFGSICWRGQWREAQPFDAAWLRSAKASSPTFAGHVVVELGKPPQFSYQVPGGPPPRPPTLELAVQEQDVAGDGTVSWISGSAPRQAGVQHVLRCSGFDHQKSYHHPAIRRLALYVVCKFATGAGLPKTERV